MKSFSFKNLLFTIVGVILVGVGVEFLNISNFGTDPFSCMNYGISGVLGMQFGNWQLLMNIILFVPMLIVGRKYIGLGTLCNMAGVGYVAQFTAYLLSLMSITEDTVTSIVVRAIFLIVGVVIVCFGVALYTKANLGISPYDAAAYIIEDIIKGKVTFKWLRIATDVVCVTVGFLTGSVIGVGTIIMMFFTGPLVQFFKDFLSPMFDSDPNLKTNSQQ
jgi:uncharacterized membrane protein YczE